MMQTVSKQEQADAINAFAESTDELVQLLSGFTQDAFNAVPFEGSWTAGQVGRHLYKSYKGMPQLLAAPAKTADRSPREKLEQIQAVFMDFSTKLKSPDFILPEEKVFDQQKLLNSLKETISEIKDVAIHADLSEICTGFSLPVVGEFTRLEWMHFLSAHTARHVHQLKKISTAFAGR